MIRHAFAYTAPINWYPGHMATASRELADRLRGVDLVLDVRDSRAPFASANPTLGALWQHKPRIVVLNKSDRISRRSQDQLSEYFRQQGTHSVFTVAHKGQGVKNLLRQVVESAEPEFRMVGAVALVAGIPNVGKSTLINAVREQHRDAGAKKKKSKVAKVGARAGVTRHISNIQASVLAVGLCSISTYVLWQLWVRMARRCPWIPRCFLSTRPASWCRKWLIHTPA